jgi:hypothetical protein
LTCAPQIFREDALGWREWEWARTNKALAGQEPSMGDTVVAFATDEYRYINVKEKKKRGGRKG